MNTARAIKVAMVAASLFGLVGCAMIQTSTISSSSAKGNNVSGQAAGWGVLHLMAPDNLTASASGEMMGQCPSGRISNVQTELQTREFFVAQMYTVSAMGFCQ